MDTKARCVSLSAGLLFALLALLCCFGAISIDEAWSIQHLRAVDSVGEIVFALKHDNNHTLNTIQLYVLGAGHAPWVYRLFPLFFGVGTVVLLLYLAAGQGFTSLGLCAGLTAFSYPLIYYAAEARGYAPMLFFAVLAFWLTQQVLAGRKSAWLFPAFWLTAVLMVLAHFSSLILLASLAIYACAAVCFA